MKISLHQSFWAWLFSSTGAATITAGLTYRLSVGTWGAHQDYGMLLPFGIMFAVIGVALHFIPDL